MAWENLTDGFFKGHKFHVAIPNKKDTFGASSQKTEKERRLQLVRYPRKDGGKVNDFGANQDVITLDIVFFGVDYLEQYNAFLDICNDGAPGILVVPVRKKALVAYYQKATEVVEVGSGGTIKATFTFVEDTTIDPIELNPPGASLVASPAVQASELSKKIADAKKSLNNNALIGAVRGAENGISAVRRYSGAVIALDQSIRSRLLSASDNTLGTLALMANAIAILTKPKALTSPAATSKNLVDADTGQEVVPFNESDVLSTVPDPLAAPVEATVNETNTPEISVNNLNSNAGVEVFSTKVGEILKSQREEIASLGGGRTDDVTKSLTQVVIALDDFKAAVARKKGTPVMVPYELSVMEIMFHNSIPLDRLDSIIRDNYHLADVLMVPAGSVVYL